jgi:hypothetical protein
MKHRIKNSKLLGALALTCLSACEVATQSSDSSTRLNSQAVTTAADARMPAPVISAPLNGGVLIDSTTTVKVRWNAVSGAVGYLVRAKNLTDANLRDPRNTANNGIYLFIDKYKATSIDLPVKKGHRYEFWVHAINSKFQYRILSSWSDENRIAFAVAADASANPNPSLASCQGVAHGATETRTMFQNASVPAGSLCVSEVQTRTCNNGSFSAFSGSFAAASCAVAVATPPASDVLTSTLGFQNIALQQNQTTSFNLKLTLTANANNIDSVAGLSTAQASDYKNLAVAVRLNPNGFLDARDGGSFRADSQVAYKAGDSFVVTLSVDLAAKKYSVLVQPKSSMQKIVLARNFAFRTEQATASALGYLALKSEILSLKVSELAASAYLLDSLFVADSGGTVQPGTGSGSGTGTTPPVVVEGPPVAPSNPGVSGNACASGSANSITQFGITWIFDRSYTCGTYANGDYWVLGPVRINSITPKDQNLNDADDMHGSMIAPAEPSNYGPQGFDSRSGAEVPYNADMNIARQLPMQIPANRSVISSISVEALTKSGRTQVETQAVLTIVASAPAADCFRPAILGNDKSCKWRTSQVNLAKLKKAVSPSHVSLADAEDMFERPLVILGYKDYYKNEYVIATGNAPYGSNYGREISLGMAFGALALNLNTTASKSLMAIRYVQRGLDIYGNVLLGDYFEPNGGHVNGFKLPVIVAGHLLGDQAILDVANGVKNPDIFSEDIAHYYISQADVSLPRRNATAAGQVGCDLYSAGVCTRELLPYSSSMIGMPEWGLLGQPNNQSSSGWGRIYRDVTGPNLVGTALAVHIMGLEQAWGRPAFLDYMNMRAWPEFSASGKMAGFVSAVWTDLRSASGKIPAGYVSSSPTGWKP